MQTRFDKLGNPADFYVAVERLKRIEGRGWDKLDRGGETIHGIVKKWHGSKFYEWPPPWSVYSRVRERTDAAKPASTIRPECFTTTNTGSPCGATTLSTQWPSSCSSLLSTPAKSKPEGSCNVPLAPAEWSKMVALSLTGALDQAPDRTFNSAYQRRCLRPSQPASRAFTAQPPKPTATPKAGSRSGFISGDKGALG